jgi:uncharacterized protein YqjF (DUF2071 family)
MHQNWHDLLFLHWAIPEEKLRPLVPAELDIDTYDGNAWVGLLPFTITGTRPLMTPPVPFLSDFHEVNVRTYVHHRGQAPGVWFFSLDASSSLAVTAARTFYHLPYYAADMRFELSEALPRSIKFDSRRTGEGSQPANCHVWYGPEESAETSAAPGSLDHFLIERYILYSRSEDQLYRARVHHAPYPLMDASVSHLEETMVWAAGVKRPDTVPLVHYSRGVSVEIFRPEKVG